MSIGSHCLLRTLLIACASLVLYPQAASSQAAYSEDFTDVTTKNDWYFTGGACLTAGNVAGGGAQPGKIAGCSSVLGSYYKLQKDGDPKLTGGDQGTLGTAPDAAQAGALRFTNGSPYGHNEAGSIVSGFAPFPTSQGVSISFKTITYGGDSGGAGGDGADGISFFLMDGCVPLAGMAGLPADACKSGLDYGALASPAQIYKPLGAIGGSLGYSCSNSNPLADGLIGAYLGLGIDEYGNFLNGTKNTLNEDGSTDTGGDNTTTGGLYQPGRIGLRGAGNLNFQLLSYLYPKDPGDPAKPYYPASMATTCPSGSGTYEPMTGKCQSCSSGGTYSTTSHTCSAGNIQDAPTYGQIAIKQACSNGRLYNNQNYSSGQAATQSFKLTNNASNTNRILDYPAIATAFTVLPSSDPIANESATQRNQQVTPLTKRANPITYKLNITQDGLLTFSLSYNGGSWQNVLTGTDIVKTNGALPQSFRFGFSGSTGGATNIHEILCFKASPIDLALDSGGVNDFQNPQITNGTQLFLASYFPTKGWAGTVTAQTLGFSTDTNSVAISSKINWDAGCVLTGGACASGAPASASAQTARNIFTWDSKNNTGVSFEYGGSGNMNSQQQAALDGDDPSGSGTNPRLAYLRGDRTNELANAKGAKLYRNRTSLLGDIIDSSPTAVGPPSTYPDNVQWTDLLNTKTPMPENSGETYKQFHTAVQSRQNIVYVGANDGLLHGFAAGSFDADNNFVAGTNDGHEVFAYMPGAISMTIHNANNTAIDYSSPQYKHAYFVDATPGTGDVLINGMWHTLLAGGFGPGGPGLYVLDVTGRDPATGLLTTPKENLTDAQKLVLMEWTPSTINGGCGNNATCGDSMGNVSGIPQIRRFHTGQWGIIFGNGLNSKNGDPGIFVALLNPTGPPSLLYFSATGVASSSNTNASATGNGITSVAAADVDSDHVVDFVYAGDMKGNLWRFDLTSTSTLVWKTTAPTLVFKEPNHNPISTQVTVSTWRSIGTVLGQTTRAPERIILNFGTGQQFPQQTDSPATYATGAQYLYGIWDGNFAAWNSGNNGKPIQPIIASPSPQTIADTTTLQKQTVTQNDSFTPVIRTVDPQKNPICWADVSGCSQYGWFMPLPGTGEQVIFDPIISPEGQFIVNTFIPVTDSTLSCNSGLPTGFTMAVVPDSGLGSPTPFFVIDGKTNADGIQLNGTGTPSLVMSGQSADANAEYLVTQTSNGSSAKPVRTNRHVVTVGQRMNWVQRR
jgi:type IV pilus assembly protein PilY1